MGKLKTYLVIFSLGWLAAFAHAESKSVAATFRGRILISDQELSPRKTDKDTIDQYKAVRRDTIVGQMSGGTKHWHFFYSAFLSDNLSSGQTVTLTFAEKGAGNRQGPPAKVQLYSVRVDEGSVLHGESSITSDDGIRAGATYDVTIMHNLRGQNRTLAQTSLLFK